MRQVKLKVSCEQIKIYCLTLTLVTHISCPCHEAVFLQIHLRLTNTTPQLTQQIQSWENLNYLQPSHFHSFPGTKVPHLPPPNATQNTHPLLQRERPLQRNNPNSRHQRRRTHRSTLLGSRCRVLLYPGSRASLLFLFRQFS